MRKLVPLLAMFSVSASAADFRAIDIGESCALVREWETAKGSTPMRPTAEGVSNIFGFQGQAFGRSVYLSYFCRNGMLFTGNYSFPVESLDQAVESYHDIHDQMLSIYGVASADRSPWNGGTDVQSASTGSPKYLTSWTSSSTIISLLLVRNQQSESPGWRVFVVVGPFHSDATTTAFDKH